MKSAFIALLLLIGFSTSNAEVLSNGPFRGLDLSSVSENEALAVTQANTDVESVLSGSEPIFAKRVEDEFHTKTDPRRHHVLRYLGEGYSIFVYKTPVKIGKNEGYIFGPQLNFHKTLDFEGYIPDFSQTKFWTKEDLEGLLSKGDGDKEWKLIPKPWKKKK